MEAGTTRPPPGGSPLGCLATPRKAWLAGGVGLVDLALVAHRLTSAPCGSAADCSELAISTASGRAIVSLSTAGHRGVVAGVALDHGELDAGAPACLVTEFSQSSPGVQKPMKPSVL